jgi:PDZ domain-containing protein
MTQRSLAGLLAVPLLIALWVVAATQPLPYVTYEPGVTVDVLDEPEGKEIIQISGHKTYRDDGQLRMTTVYVTQPRPASVSLFELMGAWLSPDDAVYPYRAVYGEDDTQESNETEGQIEMVSSQDAAIAVALTELGIAFDPAVEVISVGDDAPAEGLLEVRDVVVSVNGSPVTTTQETADAVQATPSGQQVVLVVLRDGKERTVRVTPGERDGKPFLGIDMLPSYRFPFQVSVDIDPNIGGPSAGLMFSLGIYDTLTPGSLTGGEIVAGTGTIDPEGQVGPIGGIQQKIAAAREAGAELFLVPPGNCPEAVEAPNGDMTLVRADTMHGARTAIEAWVDDEDTDLPSCEEGNA